MDTDTNQLDQQTPSEQRVDRSNDLRDGIQEVYRSIAARETGNDDTPDSSPTNDLDAGQENDDEIQQSREELQLEHEQTEEIEHENGSSRDEALDTEGQDAREGLQVAEELQNTFDYLPKDAREHLEEAGYDEDTLNQFLRLVKGQNDKYIQKTQQYSELVKVLEPHGDALAQAGVTPAQKLSQYIAWEKGILNNPLEGMIQLGNSLGFDLVKMISDKQSADAQTFEDPAQKEIKELRSRLDAQDAEKTENINNRLLAEVQNFRDAKGENGELKYPHFDKVRAYMAPHIEAGMTLEQAYNHIVEDLGVGLPPQNPEARKPRKSVTKAKKAAFSVKSNKSSSRVTQEPGTLRDDLKAGFKSLNIGR